MSIESKYINLKSPLEGSDITMCVSLDPIGDYRMKDYDFKCEFYTSSIRKCVTKEKKDMSKVSDDVYSASFNTKGMGAGAIIVRVTAWIPDASFSTGTRCEIAELLSKEIVY